MRAGVYVRQSKDRDGTGLAIARQREDCLALCAARGWEPVIYEDNDLSASTGKRRPAYEAMLAAIAAGELQAVTAWHVDRLHRRPAELETFIDLADRHHIALATVTGDIDLSTDSGRLVARIMGAVARAEVERKSARQKRAEQQAAEAGRPTGSPRPFGYAANRIDLEPLEALAVADAYEALLAGDTLVAIGRRIDAAGHTTPQGKTFKRTSVRSILLNPRNAGLRARNGTIIGTAAWPPIVTEDTWRAAVGILTSPTRRTQTGTDRRWLLSGLALCGRCDDGQTTVVAGYRRGNVIDNGDRIYRCRDHAHLGRDATFCDLVVEEAIMARFALPDARELLIDHSGLDIDALRREVDTLRVRRDSVLDLVADGLTSAGKGRATLEDLAARIRDLEARMVRVDRAPVLAPLITAPDIAEAWHACPLPRRRTAIGLLMDVTILPGKPGRGSLVPESIRIKWKI